jgi:hypothetical protein
MHQRGDKFSGICNEVSLNIPVNHRNVIRCSGVLWQPLAVNMDEGFNF